MKKFLILVAISITLLAQVPFPGGGGSGGGNNTVVVATPYITVGATKYVAATMWPFTAFFSGSFLDANTCTLTAGTNGSENVNCSLTTTNAWYSVAATTSIEAEFQSLIATNILTTIPAGGIWMCDSTNSKIYALEEVVPGAGQANAAIPVIQLSTWTETACAGTPNTPAVVANFPLLTTGILHLKLAKSGSNILSQVSQDSGQTYITLNTTAVGTITKAGIDARESGTATVNMTFLSTAVI